ncbi:MAG TPA: DNA circularization N-terminal domain-containing protein [Fibrobacteria bacterium]|nr:DNA circularization N-terminal domain-containing protein [Fibrobacteria bacterium]
MNTVRATLAGITLDWQDLTRDRKGAVVRHEYPGHHGADLEFQGWGPMEHRLKVVFLADRQADWKKLQEVLFTGASMVLEHPEKGVLNGYVDSITIKDDDRKDVVEVDISFVEDGVDLPDSFRPSAIDVAEEFRAPLISASAANIEKAFGLAAIPAPDLSDPSWLEKLGDLGNTLNSLVGTMQKQVGRMDSLIVSFTSPVSAVLSTMAWGADLPSQLSKRLAIVLDLMQGKVAGAPSPAMSARTFMANARALADSFAGTPMEGAARIQVASQGALTSARVMAADEDALRSMTAYESTPAFDASGRWVSRDVSPTQLPATADQIEAMVFDARELIQEARPWSNDPASLDRLALALQDQYRARLVDFERLVEVEILKPTPLHVVCHRHGLPYNVAERLVLLNRIRNPSFVQGKVLLYAP